MSKKNLLLMDRSITITSNSVLNTHRKHPPKGRWMMWSKLESSRVSQFVTYWIFASRVLAARGVWNARPIQKANNFSEELLSFWPTGRNILGQNSSKNFFRGQFRSLWEFLASHQKFGLKKRSSKERERGFFKEWIFEERIFQRSVFSKYEVSFWLAFRTPGWSNGKNFFKEYF